MRTISRRVVMMSLRWVAEGQHPLVQNVYVDRHKVEGHDLFRHEGGCSDEAVAARAARSSDPAFPTDSHEYLTATDRFKMGSGDPGYSNRKEHRCDVYATRIADPTVWAAAVAAVHDHPRVKPLLDGPVKEGPRPPRVNGIPAAEILGPGDHAAVTGYEVDPTGFADQRAAHDNKLEWVRAHRRELRRGASDWDEATERVQENPKYSHLVEPRTRSIDTFENGMVNVDLRLNDTKTGYVVRTWTVDPEGKVR